MERLYTIKDIMERYGVTRQTVGKWMRRGELAAYKLGSSHNAPVRIKESDLENFESSYRYWTTV